MLTKIIDFLWLHAKCPGCKKIDHKQNMTEKWFVYGWASMGSATRAFYHPKCREKLFKERPCECGKNYIKKGPVKT